MNLINNIPFVYKLQFFIDVIKIDGSKANNVFLIGQCFNRTFVLYSTEALNNALMWW